MKRNEKRVAKPKWLRVKAPAGRRYGFVKEKLKTLDLHTVCEEAHCPNVGECWGGGTATIMILGDVCTRGCRFCAVKTGNPRGALDTDEPMRVASAIEQLKLDYVVLTSVDRDDLDDGGASHFAKTIREIKAINTKILVEVLTPDFRGQRALVQCVLEAKPEVFAHNVEVVERLSPKVRDRRAGYALSLEVLKIAKEISTDTLTKTSLQVGLGESWEELSKAIEDIKNADVDILTFGQYLQPSSKHIAVKKYYSPEEFDRLEMMAKEAGFRFVAAGALVRSSYRAGELFVKGYLVEKSAKAAGPKESA